MAPAVVRPISTASPAEPPLLPGADSALQVLAAQARAEMALLAYPQRNWVPPGPPDVMDVLDVLVVGGGQTALGVCAALRAQGVARVLAIDRLPAGREGVWDQFARMPELRTPKVLNGLDMGLPALSVQRWFITRHGQQAWDGIDRIPRRAWMDYLRWYRDTLALPLANGEEVLDVRPHAADPRWLAVDTRAVDASGQPLQAGDNGHRTRLARLVVLATGIDGGGAWRVPRFIADALPLARCHHSNGAIPFDQLAGQRVGVLGHGASAFDNAVAALQAGAASVDLCFRRARLPRSNPHRHVETPGFLSHFGALPDAVRWQVARHFRQVDQPPPRGSLQLAMATPGFALHPGCGWDRVVWTGDEIDVHTPHGLLRLDHVICATGQETDLQARAELRSLAPVVARWSDRYVPEPGDDDARLAALPYLGDDYQFLPRQDAPEHDWVRRVFAFNGASYVSHGPHSTSISGHKYALPKLVRGLTRQLLLGHADGLVHGLRAFAETELDLPDDFEAQQTARHADRFEAVAVGL